jgi:UDP-N-acetylmuramyl tripeptide synthase
VAGLTSTDGIAVGERIVDRGDWSGPGGARTVLRQHDTEMAFLETARGGLLRRGLGVDRADVALITNVAEDHLGDFGSRTLDELLDIKWIVSRAVREQGCLILNADDPLLVKKAATYEGRIAWFSLDSGNSQVAQHVGNGGLAFVLQGDRLLRVNGGVRTTICCSDEIPISFGGAAIHNIANSLAAAALCDQLGIAIEFIAAGLSSMSQDLNPGRCNVYNLPHCRVLVDFAHNPHALKALLDLARALPAKRRLLAFGQAGDRTDAAIRELSRIAWDSGLDRVVVSELAAYRRGRSPGEVFGIIRDTLLELGARCDQVLHFTEESESLQAALEWAEPGDLVIMLALGDSMNVRAKLAQLAVD